ncbi:ankyrin [Tuber magnatum]|uniref:Ankyrin n=1 Tax=Tuber magnatum TaxID=42249 RepID=A0A317T1G0_9PEZI|nr:ankyrin [Tuber magnatum]
MYFIHGPGSTRKDVRVVKSFLDLGMLSFICGKPGKENHFLHSAVRTKSYTIIHTLLVCGIPSSIQDKYGKTPLSIAVEVGNVGAVKALLESIHVDINAKDMQQRTALAIAVEARNLDVLNILLGSTEVDVNARDMWDRTPLWLAAWKGYTDVVTILLYREDIEVNSEQTNKDCNQHETPLAIACCCGHVSVVQKLLTDSRVNVNTRNTKGLTPVHSSVKQHFSEIRRLLLAHPSIDVLSTCDTGHTSLHTAAEFGNLVAITQLLCHPQVVDPNITTADGWTPLGMATANGQEEVVEALGKDKRVDINAVAGEGKTAIVLAAERMWFQGMIALLRVGGVDVYKQGREGGKSFMEIFNVQCWAIRKLYQTKL